jgi:hypothetical protein
MFILHFLIVLTAILLLLAGNPEVLLPKARPFGETPLLTVISSKAQRPGKF